MLISAERLTELAKSIVRHAGGDDGAADDVANHLVEANLCGHDSHGVGMLVAYVQGVLSEQLNTDGQAEIVQENGPFLLVDGNQGFGKLCKCVYEAVHEPWCV